MGDTSDGKRHFGGDTSDRRVFRAMFLGFGRRCPKCGQGALYQGMLRVRDVCANCAEALHHQRAHDAPPYFTILIVGHIIVPLMLLLEKAASPSTPVHLALWLPLTLALTLWFLPRVKGALVGLQWAARMHGFGEASE